MLQLWVAGTLINKYGNTERNQKREFASFAKKCFEGELQSFEFKKSKRTGRNECTGSSPPLLIHTLHRYCICGISNPPKAPNKRNP